MMDRYSRINLFSSEGRLGRGIYFLFSFILPATFFWLLAAIAGQVGQLNILNNAFAYSLLALAIFAAIALLVTLTIQRNHDINQSGWLSLLLVIFPPIIIFYWLIPGSNGINSYGEPAYPMPKLMKWLSPLIYVALLAFSIYFLVNAWDMITLELGKFFPGITKLV